MNDQENTGIEFLKSSVKEVMDVGLKISSALSDGKIDWTEGIGIAWELKDLYKIYENREKIKQELQDLDESEVNELHDYMAEIFDIENDQLEAKIEKCIDLCVVIYELIELF